METSSYINYSIHHNGNNPCSTHVLVDYCRLNKYTEKATHFIPSTHSTIEKGKISVVVPLSLTCPSIPCFTLTLEQGSNTLFQSCYSSSCLMPFLVTPTQSTSRKVLVYLEGMLPSGSFLLQRTWHFAKHNTCSDGLFSLLLSFLFSHDTQHVSSGYHDLLFSITCYSGCDTRCSLAI